MTDEEMTQCRFYRMAYESSIWLDSASQTERIIFEAVE